MAFLLESARKELAVKPSRAIQDLPFGSASPACPGNSGTDSEPRVIFRQVNDLSAMDDATLKFGLTAFAQRILALLQARGSNTSVQRQIGDFIRWTKSHPTLTAMKHPELISAVLEVIGKFSRLSKRNRQLRVGMFDATVQPVPTRCRFL